MNPQLIAAIRGGLAERSDSVRAAAAQAYMKSEMSYRGVSNPALQQLCRSVLPLYPVGSFAEWRETVLVLWDEAEYREERYAALAVIGHRGYAAFRTLEALPLFERLIVSGAW